MEPCNDVVFKYGRSICTLDACMHRAEVFVRAVARKSGQAVDWHYSGGIANVLYIGDYGKVSTAIDKLAPMLTGETWRRPGECGSCPKKGRHRAGTILQRFGPKAHGPYRAGDPLPGDVIAVVTH